VRVEYLLFVQRLAIAFIALCVFRRTAAVSYKQRSSLLHPTHHYRLHSTHTLTVDTSLQTSFHTLTLPPHYRHNSTLSLYHIVTDFIPHSYYSRSTQRQQNCSKVIARVSELLLPLCGRSRHAADTRFPIFAQHGQQIMFDFLPVLREFLAILLPLCGRFGQRYC
jgi:hypothetical protein